MSKPKTKTYASVWDALADTLEQAANLRARSDSCNNLRPLFLKVAAQVEAAKQCGVLSYVQMIFCVVNKKPVLVPKIECFQPPGGHFADGFHPVSIPLDPRSMIPFVSIIDNRPQLHFELESAML